MRIDEVLKKAAGLLVELPEEQQKPAKPWSVMDDPTPSQPIPARQPESKLADLKPAPTTRTVEQVVREAPGPNLDEIKPTANPAEPVIDGSGNVNYAMIYVLANLPSSPLASADPCTPVHARLLKARRSPSLSPQIRASACRVSRLILWLRGPFTLL